MFVLLRIYSLSREWGASRVHVSSRAAKSDTLWCRWCYSCVPLTPNCWISLILARSRHGTITLSAPCSAFASFRRTSTLVAPLLFTCDHLWNLTSYPTFFNYSSGSRWLIVSCFFFLDIGFLPSLSLFCIYLALLCCCRVFSLSLSYICPGYEGSPKADQPTNQTDLAWSCIPRLLPPCHPPPLRTPRPPPWGSWLKFLYLSRPFLRPLPTECKRWTSQGPHWTTTQDL